MAASTKGSGNHLDADERNAMSDNSYAFPDERKEPLNDASHVRNAIARFDQVQDVSDEERSRAFNRIKKAADTFGVEMTATSWRELGKPAGGSGSGGSGSGGSGSGGSGSGRSGSGGSESGRSRAGGSRAGGSRAGGSRSGSARSDRTRSSGDGPTREELYAEAQRRDVKGRSAMTKAQLERALRG